jgi:hypothetical protein
MIIKIKTASGGLDNFFARFLFAVPLKQRYHSRVGCQSVCFKIAIRT